MDSVMPLLGPINMMKGYKNYTQSWVILVKLIAKLINM